MLNSLNPISTVVKVEGHQLAVCAEFGKLGEQDEAGQREPGKECISRVPLKGSFEGVYKGYYKGSIRLLLKRGLNS